MFGKRKAKTPAAPPTDWERVERIFTNVSGMKVGKTWTSAFSERIGPRRMVWGQ